MKKHFKVISLILAAVLIITTCFFNFKTASASNETEVVPNVTARVEIINSWSNGSTTSYQMQVVINNNSSSPIKNWNFSIELPESSALSASWNGTSSIEGNMLKVTDAGYNATIYAGSNVTYGCIFNTPNKYTDGVQTMTLDGVTYSIKEAAPVTTPVPDTQASELPSQYSAGLKTVNSWSSGSNNYYQLELSIANNSPISISEWSVKLAMPESTTLSAFWCGTYSMEGDVISIEPMSYNSRILSGSVLNNVGFIICTPNEFKESSIILVLDGQKYFVNSSVLPEATVTPSVTETPEAAATPSVTETPEATAAPSVTEAPEATVTPSVTEAPEATASPVPTKAPTAAPAPTSTPAASGSPVALHGQLSVSGTTIVDEYGEPFQLRGVSTHGIAWFPGYVNEDAFKTWEDYGANVIRLALYSDPNAGYNTSLHTLVDNGVQYASNLGMYVIIDWHILSDGNPNTYKSQAAAFFKEMSAKYADYNNVIYEICNEPNGVSWSEVKSYAEDIIDVIRANDDDAIIIVGTPTWSQDVDTVSNDPITGEKNIVYALHFYAATHTDFLRSKAQTAINNGLALFVSEFGMCDASGSGANNMYQANKWIEFLNSNNISYVCWNLSNKNETSALISSGCSKTSGWTYDELSESGKWLADTLASY